MIKIHYTELKPNPNNPRYLKEEKFKLLKKSLVDFPKMLELRPIIVDKDNMVLGGNMRLQAIQALVAEGKKEFEEVPVIRVEDLTDKQKKEFIIKDNVSYGEWDWDILSSEWETQELNDWGLTFLPLGNPDDQQLWEGMPDMGGSEGYAVHKSVQINFENEEAVQEFAKLIGQKITPDTRSLWHPYKPKEDMKSMEFKNES